MRISTKVKNFYYSMSGFSAEKVGAILKISFTLNTAYGESAEVYTI